MCTEKAWAKSRSAILEKVGKENLNDDNKVKSRAKEVFEEIDTDGNKVIDEHELKEAMAKMGVELTTKEVKKMMQEADEDECAHATALAHPHTRSSQAPTRPKAPRSGTHWCMPLSLATPQR